MTGGKLKNLFERTSVRERVMLLAFMVVMLLIWLSYWSREWESVRTSLSTAREDLSEQEVWLESSDLFEGELNRLTERIDRDRTYDGTALAAHLDALAREADIRHEISSPRTVEEGGFRRHRVNLALRNIPLDRLIIMVERIREEHPYLSIEEMDLSVNRTDPRLLNPRLIIQSIEPIRNDEN